MHLPRHTIESHASVPLFRHASFCSPDPTSLRSSSMSGPAPAGAAASASINELTQPAIFSCASQNGFMVSQTDPLKLVAKRSWSASQGGLSHAVPVQHTSLLLLVGGGRVPRFSPNKVILWDEAAEYTAKPSASIPRDADSDDDQDDVGSVSSRRASTIFSAGSEFDAYAKPSIDDPRIAAGTARTYGNSAPSAEHLSASSLSDHADLNQPIAFSTDPVILKRGHTSSHSLDRNFGESSLGIGRLQASSDPYAAGDAASASMVIGDSTAGLSSSFQSNSILSSSANLDDPFAEEDSHSAGSAQPASSRSSSAASSHPARSGSVKPNAASRPLPLTGPAATSAGMFFNESSRLTGAGLVDSVSSMATTATDATAKARPTIMHGREIAELEFSQVVRGICATSVHFVTDADKTQTWKGKGRANNEGASSSKSRSQPFSVVLLVILDSKAVIFELSPPAKASGLDGTAVSSSWRIRKRTAVQTYKNPKGLGSIATHYGNTSATSPKQASVVVAVPGRQKGHVQLLHFRSQSLATPVNLPLLSNSASSLGAASIIVAHESSLAAITLSPDARFLATASSKGTLIRVWANSFGADAESSARHDRISASASPSSNPGRTGFGAKLTRQLRRGTDPATILSIAFSPDASLVAAASDKGTVHVYLLDDRALSAHSNAVDPEKPTPTSSSRTATLGRAAAQYLPSGIGNLAGQIPSSVLPQYLKSEWSSAQFRIPLKSFGASSRHYNDATSMTDGGGGQAASSSKRTGTDRSTEGAWAQMRSRIGDIRKGEPSVEESIFLCWVVEASTATDRSTNPLKGVMTRDLPSLSSKSRDRAAFDRLGHTVDATLTVAEQLRLIALTTSGGWYKLAVTLPSMQSEKDASGSTVLDMYRRDAGSNSKETNALECHLVEYRPMAALLDGWTA
ncbi:Autophagy-related protein 21 [Pseudozyma hubeiensis]|nr:Autophagy-related protein 21 [Pseudozyma hubeiensis]